MHCVSIRMPIAKKMINFIYHKTLQEKGSWISVAAEFETVPIFPHGIFGVFISGGVKIGNNCVIFQQVTIGSNTLIDSTGFGAPVIGNNCYIGAGAKIIGKVTIGNNVRIGANAVVTKDVPDNTVVTSAPNTIVTRVSTLNNRFYHKYNGEWCYYDMDKRIKVTAQNELNTLNSQYP